MSGNIFTVEPDDVYLVDKTEPIKITCQAKNVAEITFECFSKRIPDTSIEKVTDDTVPENEVQASINVTYTDVTNNNGENSILCECLAVDATDAVIGRSKKAKITAVGKQIFKGTL